MAVHRSIVRMPASVERCSKKISLKNQPKKAAQPPNMAL